MTASAHDDVTVVITNYDYGRLLPEAVGSALAQDGGPPRVIVVDDGSTEPGTDAVLDALPAGVEVIRQANQGQSAARNAGLARARTPYLLVLDADDRLLPGALAALKPVLSENPGLGFAYGYARFFGTYEGVLRMPPYDPYALLYRHMIGLSALMRRKVYEDTGGFDSRFRGYEDWELWVHALACGWEGRRVEVETLEYRRHATSVNTEARRRYHDWWRLLRGKHAALYARRRALARRSALGPVQRAVYRGYWGPRPLPAALEARLYDRVFSSASSSGSVNDPPSTIRSQIQSR